MPRRGTQKLEDASDMFSRAGNAYKMAKAWDSKFPHDPHDWIGFISECLCEAGSHVQVKWYKYRISGGF